MSTLGFCNLDEAFNTSSSLSKKKKKHSRRTINDETMDKILGRGKEIDTGILPGGPLPGEPMPNETISKLSTDSDYVNSLADTYDKNSLFVQERQKELLSKEKNKDLKPNEWQNQKNDESKKVMDELKMQILDLTNIVNGLVKSIQEPSEKESLKEGFANYNTDTNIVNRFKSGITFDNDQFNELLLYVFTGIFLLIMIDYIYNLGKKAF